MPSRMTIHHLLIAAFVISGTSASLSAQTATTVSPDTVSPRLENPGTDPRFFLRVFPAIGMGAAGAFLGGLIGLQGLGTETLGSFGIGVLAGGTLGSAIGAAALKGRGFCTENQRFGRALAGATLGLAAGVAIVRSEGHVAWLAAIPVGSVMFMTRC